MFAPCSPLSMVSARPVAAHARSGATLSAPRRLMSWRRRAVPEMVPRSDDDGLQYDHLLLAIVDSNPYLNDGSKQAIAAAAGMGRLHRSKVTVLVIDQPGEQVDPAVRLENINWHFKEHGFDGMVEYVEKPGDVPSAVLVGDVADQLACDFLVLSTEVVHSKHVDANLLAEMVPCPVLLLP